jgi:hypothetical protein
MWSKNTAWPFVLVLLCYFTCKCYPSWVTFMIPESFLKISVRVINKYLIYYFDRVDQILMTIKQLKQVTPWCINWLCLSLLCIMYMLSGHSAAQEIKHIYESLSVVLLDLKSSILREVSTCHRGPKAVMFRLAKFLMEALMVNSLIFKCPKSHGTVLVKCSLKAFILIGWLLHYLYSLRAVFLINIET